MNLVHEVISYLVNQPASTWTTLGSYLAGSTLVAGLLQVVKHKFNFADAQKLVTFMLGFFSFLAAFADYLLQANATNPLPTLGRTTGLLIGGAVLVHRYAVSPGYYKFIAQAGKFSNFLKDLQAFQASQKAAAPAAPATPVDEANLSQFQV